MIGVHVYHRGRLRLVTVAPSAAAGRELATRLLGASPAEVRRLGGELVVIGPPIVVARTDLAGRVAR